MKKMLVLLLMFCCFYSNVFAIEIKSATKSCNQVASVLTKNFLYEPTGYAVMAFIRVDTINHFSFGNTEKLHEEFCIFLMSKGFQVEEYEVEVIKNGRYRIKKKWMSNCRIRIPEVENQEKDIEIIVEGNEFADSFYRLYENDRLFNHHRYRGEGHQEFFEYIYDKLLTQLREDLFLYPQK